MLGTISSIVKAFSSLLLKKDQNFPAAAMERYSDAIPANITILSLPGTDEDRQLLEDVSRRYNWQMSFASTTDEARESLRRAKPQIILIDRKIDGEDWRYAVSSLAAASSGACVLLMSQVTDDYLWNEVVTNGGFDVLRKPLTESEILRNVKLAWSYWNGTRPSAGVVRK